jgi:hypothetical protein
VEEKVAVFCPVHGVAPLSLNHCSEQDSTVRVRKKQGFTNSNWKQKTWRTLLLIHVSRMQGALDNVKESQYDLLDLLLWVKNVRRL